jgi:hypothetical protein
MQQKIIIIARWLLLEPLLLILDEPTKGIEDKVMNSANAQRSLASDLVRRLEIRMLALAIALGAALSVLSPHFLTSDNLLNVLDQSVVVGMVAIGMTFVILIGAMSDFLTNRTGFVVLHPIEGVACAACAIEHVDGTIEETRFPLSSHRGQ